MFIFKPPSSRLKEIVNINLMLHKRHMRYHHDGYIISWAIIFLITFRVINCDIVSKIYLITLLPRVTPDIMDK